MDSDTLAMLIILPLSGLVLLTLVVGAVLVVRDTARHSGNFGINTEQVHCPRCGEPAPILRSPKNWRQSLWGGCTCTKCGAEYDKWGQLVDWPGKEQSVSELKPRQ
jgi:hypothetical protein